MDIMTSSNRKLGFSNEYSMLISNTPWTFEELGQQLTKENI